MKRILLNLLGVLAAGSSLNIHLSTALAQGTNFTALTITNPAPAFRDYFGYSVAAVGTNCVLIGAYWDDVGANNAGAAYLFDTNGALLTTFTNPTPAVDDYFGYSVAAVGTDRVLIGAFGDNTGAHWAGAAYLFSTNGELFITFTNPTPATEDGFGASVAAVGVERVLIGAGGDNTGAADAGAAYLFSTNGALVTTFTNPAPAVGDSFGYSVAAMGTDRILIGAVADNTGVTDAGVAYLFGTNGALLTTFTNPTPAYADFFGYPVAAMGTDRVLIGAYWDDVSGPDTGVAYLFATNGTLLTTFTNPTPTDYDLFGYSLAALGSDRVLIGAPGDDTGATDAGAAYLFSTSGTLLATLTNPIPADYDGFGTSMAALGSDRVVIGAYLDDIGATDAGAAYLFKLEPFTPEAPSLTICLTTTNTVAVSWPSPSTDWTLQENTNGVASVNWSNAPGKIQDDGTTKTLIINPPTGNQFYRLFKP